MLQLYYVLDKLRGTIYIYCNCHENLTLNSSTNKTYTHINLKTEIKLNSQHRLYNCHKLKEYHYVK